MPKLLRVPLCCLTLGTITLLTACEPDAHEATVKSKPDDTEILVEASSDNESLTMTVNHATIVRALNDDNLARGKSIFKSHCIQCHGQDGLQTTNETARAFGKDPFKNGGDVLSLWRTLTNGLGNMPAQNWLSPRERYDVIHYLRETIIKDKNPGQYVAVTESYLESLPIEEATFQPAWQNVTSLEPFNGKDLTGWLYQTNVDQKTVYKTDPPSWKVGTAVLDPEDPGKLVARPGGNEMVNITSGQNIWCNTVHGDAVIEIEIFVPRGSNSGIYLMGRYELQILDSHGVEDNAFTAHHMGAVYGKRKPLVNASKPFGEWQRLEIHFSAPRFEIGGKKYQNAKILQAILNDRLIHEDVEIHSATGGSLYPDESAFGPLYLQGDHGPIAYRNLKITPIQTDERDFGPALGSQLGKHVSSALTVKLGHDVSLCYDLQRMKQAGVWRGDFLNISETQHHRLRGGGTALPGGPELEGLDTWYWGYEGALDYPQDRVSPRSPLPTEWLDYHGYYLHGNQLVLSYAISARDIFETAAAHKEDELMALSHTLHIGPGAAPLKLCVGQQDQEDEMQVGVIHQDGTFPPLGSNGSASDRFIVSSSRLEDGSLGRFVIAGILGETTGYRWETDFELACTEPAAPNPANPCEAHPGPQDEYGGGQLPFQSPGVTGYAYASNIAPTWNDIASAAVGQCPLDVTNNKRTALSFGASSREYYEVILDTPLCVRGIDMNTISYEYTQPVDFDNDPVISHWDASQCDYVPVKNQRFSPGDWPTSGERVVTFDPVNSTRFRFSKNGKGNYWYIHPEFQLLELEDRQRLSLHIPASKDSHRVRIVRASGEGRADLNRFVKLFESLRQDTIRDPATLTKGGPRRWKQTLVTRGKLSTEKKPYVVDTIPLPEKNPWNSWQRTAALDFFDDGRIALSTHGGEVWVISGIDDQLGEVRWRRLAAGLFEPLGLKVVDDRVYLTCRDRIVRLNDLNDDGEADFYENFYSGTDVPTGYHAYNFDLQTDSDGNFYYMKTGRFTDFALPGAVMKVSPDGKTGEVVCTGFRVPNGMALGPGNTIYTSDNQGEYVPASKINRVEPGGFYGVAKADAKQPETFDQPILWMPQEFDNSSGGQLWIEDKRWGPLSGRLLHTSFGKGTLCSVMIQEFGDVAQAAAVTLPLEFESGIMRARVNPGDGQVYVTGLTGWGHPVAARDGCLQRVRYTGEKAYLLLDTEVQSNGITLQFSCKLDAMSATTIKNYQIEEWEYLWTPNYGSADYSIKNPGVKGRDSVEITTARVSEDGKEVSLKIPSIHPVQQMKIRLKIAAADGTPIEETIYRTIHRVP